jgi:putative transposase
MTRFLQQQARFDQFISTFNPERPYAALNVRYPAELYTPSPRSYNGLPDLEYPFHDRTITVTRCGRICMGPLKINLSQAFAGQKVGVKQVEDKIWRVSFMRYDLGFFDHETCRIESVDNPFAAKLLLGLKGSSKHWSLEYRLEFSSPESAEGGY